MITIYFFYGLAFFTLGVALLVRNTPRSLRPLAPGFKLIGLFGIAHAIDEWFVMAIFGYSLSFVQNNALLKWLPFTALCLSAVAYCSLLIAALFLSNTCSLKRRVVCWTVGLTSLIVWFSTAFWVRDGTLFPDWFAMATRWCLGLPASVAMAYAFIKASKSMFLPVEDRDQFAKQNRFLIYYFYLIAACFFTYGVLIVVSTSGNIYPTEAFSNDGFFQIFGMPVQIARAMIAVLLTMSLLLFLRRFSLYENLDLSRMITESTQELLQAKTAAEQADREKSDLLEEIRKQNALLETQREASPDGILVADLNGVTLACNRQFQDMFCDPIACWSAQCGHESLLDHEDLFNEPELFKQEVQRLNAHPEEEEVGCEIRLANGQVYIRYSKGMQDEEGRYWGRTWFYRDITKRKNVEDNLKESEERFRALVNSSLDAIVVHDGKQILYANPATLSMMGMEEDQILGRSPLDLVYPDYRRQTESKIIKALRHGDASTVETLMQRDDGSTFEAEVLAFHMVLHNRKVVQVLVRDVSERKESAEAIKRIEERYTLAARIGGSAAWEIWPYTGNFIFDDNLASLLGYEESDLGTDLGHWFATVHEDDREKLMRAIFDVAAGKQDSFAMEHRVVRKDASIGWFYEQGKRLSAPGEVPVRIVGSTLDITKRKKTEASLLQNNAALESTEDGVIVTDLMGKITYVNRAFTSITGYSKAEAVGQTPRLLKSDRHDEQFYNKLWKHLKINGSWQGEIWNKRKNDELYPQWETISTVRNSSGEATHYVAVFSDITRIKQSQAELEFLAHHDPLTELPNRLLFLSRLQHALVTKRHKQEEAAVVLLDLDGFKHVNDSLGHSIGDRLICQVAKRLRVTLDEEDTVARLGGDEFLILVESIQSANELIPILESVIHAFKKPFIVDQYELRVGASVGVRLFPEAEDTVDELIKHADAAMYRAKEEGGNTFRFYSREMTQRAIERLTLESELKNALEQEEFSLHYQPQVNIRTGQIVAVEALIRWEHPQKGIIPPGRFIPIAEDSGVIIPLGRWVLEQACLQAKKWVDQGLLFGRVAVNVSAIQLNRDELTELVKSTLAATELPPHHLELELTESALIEPSDEILRVLEEIRELGVTLAIDDFGTGYSSLSYLKKLPIDKLKLDKRFVADLPADEHDVAIAKAVIALGKALDLQVLVEGVESEEQREFFMKEGAVEAQGFLWVQPKSSIDLTAVFAEVS